MQIKYAIIFGTRPEYLKLKPIIYEFYKSYEKYKIIYITQHAKIEEEIPEETEILPIVNIDKNRLSQIGSEILTKLPNYIIDCTNIIVQGDTTTAFYCALTAYQLQKRIIHVEAGLRTYDLENPFPEEANRQMISRIATIHFTPHEECVAILKDEKISGQIYNVGNTILDLIQSYNLTCNMQNIVLITFHRRENWNKIDILLIGLQKLVKKTPHIKYIWYLHPNPDLQEKVKRMIQSIPTIEIQNPCNHLEFTKQMAACNFLITDSGGIQEEASYLGKHCIVLRSSTERNHIGKEYITVLKDYSLLSDIYEDIPKSPLIPCNVYGYGNSSKKIMEILSES